MVVDLSTVHRRNTRLTTARIAVVVGNPRPGSRTRGAAKALAGSLAARLDARWSPTEIHDLADLGTRLVTGGGTAGDLLRGADVVIVATPVYKASFTGLLKLFLDRLPVDGLAGTVAVPVTVAAAASHRTLADLHLRPVLSELGASLPAPSFLLEERELATLPALADRWAARHAPVVQAAVGALRTAEVPT